MSAPDPVSPQQCAAARADCATARKGDFRFLSRALWAALAFLLGGAVAFASSVASSLSETSETLAVVQWRVDALELLTSTTLPRIDSSLMAIQIQVAASRDHKGEHQP